MSLAASIVDFPPCAVCGAQDWRNVHSGPVRDFVHGKTREACVNRCGGCGIDRLAESVCLQAAAYASAEYRERLLQGHDVGRHFAEHDELARFTLDALWPLSLRGKIVADVGCGGGVLLDHVRGVAARIVAIDPSELFAPSLKERGYAWFPSASAAAAQYTGKIDVAFSTQVIEHVDDPRSFLHDIGTLLSPDGIALISTPNRADILMELLPQTFPAFFYRTQHRWAFDAQSLARCAELAGLEVSELRHVHRYGMSNTLHWLRDGKPRGRTRMPPIDDALDKHWQAWLESNGRADNLYMTVRRVRASHSS
jgi:2-polyprenyl-3-methyl-5-hydroxy-6-metoxy-1,4-benzoquinol methylase